MQYETKVREFYDSAGFCYEDVLGATWHHGDPEAEKRGMSLLQAAQLLEETLVAQTGLKAGERALDFGTGVGGPTVYMAKISQAFFVGITNHEGLNQKARRRAAEAALSDKAVFITIGDTDYQHLPFPDNSFDAVFFYESVCHLTDKQAFFREAHRVLKPGRRLAGTDWLQRSFGKYQTEEQIMEIMMPLNDITCIPWHGTVANYRSMMETAGFDVLVARDLFDGVLCWGTTPDNHREHLQRYDGPNWDQFRKGKKALDDAKAAGVFTVGMFVAEKKVPIT